MKKNIREQISDIIKNRYSDKDLPQLNLKAVSGRIVCRNCGKEGSCYNILGNPNNYCGNCGIRLGFPYMAEPFDNKKEVGHA